MDNFLVSFLKKTKMKSDVQILDEKKLMDEEVLINEVMDTRNELNRARKNLGHVLDPDIMDYYIYQIKALEAKYKYLNTILKKEKIFNRKSINRIS